MIYSFYLFCFLCYIFYNYCHKKSAKHPIIAPLILFVIIGFFYNKFEYQLNAFLINKLFILINKRYVKFKINIF